MTDHIAESSETTPVDLTNCDREPIHLLGNVQGYGCLISTSFDLMINHVSANITKLLGIDPQAALGNNLRNLLPPDTIHDLNNTLQQVSRDTNVGRLFDVDVLQNGRKFDVSIHLSGKSYVIEFEPITSKADRDDLALVQPLVNRLRRTKTVSEALDEGALAIQILSGFDRVMIYKFAEDGTGEVVAEQRQPNMEPYLGLRYPSSDIPQQARALYKKSLLRLIADVDGEVSAIVPPKNTDGAPLDLSLSVTRAVSTIHLEYLRNMGVAASMSVSILKDGELWGLFACHHTTPKYIDYARRSAIELYAQFLSYELLMKDEQEAQREERNARLIHDRLLIQLSQSSDLIEGFDLVADELSEIIKCDGISVYSDRRYKARGKAPTAEEFLPISRFLNTAPMGEIFATDNLTSHLPEAEVISGRVSGLLAIPISRAPRDFIVFYREEIARSITWAGNPEKPVEPGPNGMRLTPRKSFEAWEEIVRGVCENWTSAEKRSAEALRQSLIEIVLKLTDEANVARKKATETQELLIAELNHRVRNILNLISSLVTQSKDDAGTIDAYTTVLEGRVQALAMAHDQLTRSEWEPTSLRDLIDVELSAFVTNQSAQLSITGAAPLISPDAFSTIALVMHEMVTNSVKYGALSVKSGLVAVDLSLGPDDALHMTWRETGGPSVQAPTRRGFGSTIIEKSIPYELGGTVATRYRITGFEADIMIPARYVSAGSVDDTKPAAATVNATQSAPLLSNVLIVEDNMLIALDVDGILRNNGALQTHMASSVETALALIAAEQFTVAVLDVNLGNQTSLPIAQKLEASGVPFILASGYGDAESMVQSYPRVPIVGKPLTAETLMVAINRALSGD